jgi:hypothetical protein
MPVPVSVPVSDEGPSGWFLDSVLLVLDLDALRSEAGGVKEGRGQGLPHSAYSFGGRSDENEHEYDLFWG